MSDKFKPRQQRFPKQSAKKSQPKNKAPKQRNEKKTIDASSFASFYWDHEGREP